MLPEERLKELWQKGTKFLGCKYSIMGGAMSWISEHNLVSAISKAGGFGVIACSAMNPEQLEKEIELTQKILQNNYNFGVNLITIHPQLEELLNVCIKNNISHVILAGLPSKAIITKLKNSGIKVLSFAPSATIAKKLIKIGIDAIIIEGMEAGGHIGPVSTSVLAQEIIPIAKESVPVFVAGGIGTGKIIVNYLNMGASGCQIGTLFACAKESIAHPKFKEAFFRASSYDTIVSTQLDEDFKVIPVRSIKNLAVKEFINFQKQIIEKYNKKEVTKEEGQLQIEKYWAGSLKNAVIKGDVESGSLMAGQIVGLVKEELTTNLIIENLIKEAIHYIHNIMDIA